MRTMSRLALAAGAAACLLLSVGSVRAENAITITTSSRGTKTITASGTYKLDAGWRVTSITFSGAPTAGGVVSAQAAVFDDKKKVWKSTTIKRTQPDVEYGVYVLMTITNGTKTQDIASAYLTLPGLQ